MVKNKPKQHAVKFDPDERNAFLKKFCGKSAKKTREKKAAKEKKGRKGKGLSKVVKNGRKDDGNLGIREKQGKVIEYHDTDRVNNVQVTITTTYSDS
jgi:hypothetical protein